MESTQGGSVEFEQHTIRLRPRSDVDYISQDRTILLTGLDGFVHGGKEEGFFVHETRILSRYAWSIDGRAPQLVCISNVHQHRSLAYYIAPPPSKPEEDAAQQAIELLLARYAGQGVHEEVELTNHTQNEEEFTLALEVDADFADLSEPDKGTLANGRISSNWRNAGDRWELAFHYSAEHAYDHQNERGVARIERGSILRIQHPATPPSYERGTITFRVRLAPHARWHACIDAVAVIDGAELAPLYGCGAANRETEYERKRGIFQAECTRFQTAESGTLSSVVIGALERGERDLGAMRLYDLDTDDHSWVMAAGLPTYLGLFGRDALSAAWQIGILSPAVMRGSLAALRDSQGKEINDWRDEQPGRILHQANAGPAAVLKFNPLGRYYGDQTASPFYAFVTSALWHWTGDKQLVAGFLDAALKGVKWRDDYTRLRPGGFSWYQTRSEQGLRNQGWKDSGDAMVYADGRQVEPPIATCEGQGYEYVSKLRLAELLWWFDRADDARHFYQEATELKKRFNEAYWMEEEGFVAMALDSNQQQVTSISSNPGHCLATAIIDESRAQRVADRLMAPDLFSGWGVRTLSADHPAYNPFAYHRGTVWPAEQAVIALAFARYGLHDYAERIARAQFEAAAMFNFFRLPEVFSGHPRDDEHPFPGVYPRSDSPQAWSASAVFAHVQALTGLYPFAPLRLLLLDPHLPSWLPELTVTALRVGDAEADIRFSRREDGSSDYRVLDIRGKLRVVRQPSPWSLTAGYGERVRDVLTSLLAA